MDDTGIPLYSCRYIQNLRIFTLRSNLVIRCLDILFSALTSFPILFLGRKLSAKPLRLSADGSGLSLPPRSTFRWSGLDMSLSALVLTLALGSATK